MPDSSPLRVLVADDNEDIAQLLEALLNAEDGIACVGCVDDAGKVTEAVSRLSVDVLLLDLELRGVSGIKVLRECRESYPELTIVILTGHADPTLRRAAIAAGAADFLVKPDDIASLGARIHRARSPA